MTVIKEKTDDLHTALEDLPFNQKLFRGELTALERSAYLQTHYHIFSTLDKHVSSDLKRAHYILRDIAVLPKYVMPKYSELSEYIRHLTGYQLRDTEIISSAARDGNERQETLAPACDPNPHIYLNYMGLMFGGQIMRKRYPETSQLYEFNDLVALRAYIREEVCSETQEFIDEVRLGFQFQINISTALGNAFGLN